MVKVLVVDDELDFCSSLGEALTREGYEVIVANSGFEAIEKVKAEKPQLILLDIRMPQMDGLQALERIRCIDREAVITMVTVVKDPDVQKKSMKLGAVNYITKPLDIELLKRSLQNWATQIQTKQLAGTDILALEYNEEKFKTILDLFRKKGYNIKCIENKGVEFEAEQRPPDLVMLRFDILGEEGMVLLSKYKKEYPQLPIMIALGKTPPAETVNRIKDYGACSYLPAFVNSSGLVLIAYNMISGSKEKAEIKKDTKPSEYILIVDDDSDICEYTSKYLSREGYKVCCVSDSKMALNQVEALKPSIVLLDVVMPDVDGLELLKKIKKINPRARVIMMTGLKDDSVCREVIESGASDFIVKPFSLDQLKATILINSIKLHQS